MYIVQTSIDGGESWQDAAECKTSREAENAKRDIDIVAYLGGTDSKVVRE